MKKIIIPIFVLCFTAICIAGCGKAKEGAGRKSEEAVPVKVMKIEPRHIYETLEYVGNIKGQDEALVYPKVTGKIIEKVKENGSKVVKGDVIAYIDRDEVGLTFEKAPVESPLSGEVGRVFVDIGSSVTPQTAVALVTDVSKIEIDLDIPEKYLPRVSIGQDAEVIVDAYPDEIFKGKVTMISPVVDLQTRAAPIEIKLDNKERKLQSGMFAKVKLIIKDSRSKPIVLRDAIVGKEPNTYVYVIQGNRASLRKVSLGIRQGPYYEVLGGLETGDKVIVMGQQRLRDGSTVMVEEQE
jgi:membrane fusion protein, multidrug efflux system